MAVEAWLLLATLTLLLWMYSRWRHSYWAKLGVQCPPSYPVIGHMHKSVLFSKTPWNIQKEFCSKFHASGMCGLYEFFKPVLWVWNPEVLKHIFVKDFDHFTDRRDFKMESGHERDAVMMEMLSVKNGEGWKSLRAIMTPTFTSGKMKSMFPLVCEKADALVQYSMKQALHNASVDMKKNFGRYTMDTIASCAFGIECNSLVDEKAEFPRKADIFFTFTPKRLLKFVGITVVPKLFEYFAISVNPPELDFFIDVVNRTVAARKAGKKRWDFLDLLLEARENALTTNGEHVLGDRSLVAQCVLFIIAGYDTTASLLAFSSYLLAKHKEQQQRLREEVRKVVEEYGEINYQGIMEAKFLDACLQETLRLYPPAVMAERSCVKSYTLPDTDITIAPGDIVQIPIYNIHHDPQYWPNPEAFIPDRFMPEQKSTIRPFTHLPFGMGPRNCIAMRFALMEAKVVLSKLLLAAEIELAPGYEVDISAFGGLMRPKDGVKVVLKPIKEE